MNIFYQGFEAATLCRVRGQVSEPDIDIFGWVITEAVSMMVTILMMMVITTKMVHLAMISRIVLTSLSVPGLSPAWAPLQENFFDSKISTPARET